MKNITTPLLALGCVTTVLAAVPAIADDACNRACLTETLDRYLDAVVAQDPTHAPLSDA